MASRRSRILGRPRVALLGLCAWTAWAASSCGATRDAPADPKAPVVAATSAGAAEAPGARASTGARRGATNPRIEAALAVVTQAAFRADVTAIAIPRHAALAPMGLAQVSSHLERTLRGLGYAVSRQPVTYRGLQADNVIADRAGTGPEPRPVVLATAHYDAVAGSPGADDNASGVAGALAVARAAAALPTACDVRVVAFAFEEQGLVGSRAYVSALSSAERDRVRAVFNLEMIGYRDARPNSQRFPPGFEDLRDTGDALPTTGDFIGALALASMAEPLEVLEESRAYVPGLKLETITVPKLLVPFFTDVLRSDHAAFWLRGIPAVIVADTAELRNPNYHRASDTPETLDVAFATQVAKLVTAAVLETATR